MYMYIYLRAQETQKQLAKDAQTKTTCCTTFRDMVHTSIHNIPGFCEEFQVQDTKNVP